MAQRNPVLVFVLGLGLWGVELSAPELLPEFPRWIWEWVFVASTVLTAIGVLWALFISIEPTAREVARNWLLREPQKAQQGSPSTAYLQQFSLEEPNYEAWDHINWFTVGRAARAWAEEDPNTPFFSSDCSAYFQMICEAIHDRKIAAGQNLAEQMSIRQRGAQAVTERTKIHRSELLKLAELTRQKPKFLYPEER